TYPRPRRSPQQIIGAAGRVAPRRCDAERIRIEQTTRGPEAANAGATAQGCAATVGATAPRGDRRPTGEYIREAARGAFLRGRRAQNQLTRATRGDPAEWRFEGRRSPSTRRPAGRADSRAARGADAHAPEFGRIRAHSSTA